MPRPNVRSLVCSVVVLGAIAPDERQEQERQQKPDTDDSGVLDSHNLPWLAEPYLLVYRLPYSSQIML